MRTKILEAIDQVIAEKEAAGEAFPCAHSVEVARKLKMNAQELELIAKGIEGITIHLTLNGAYYETKTCGYPEGYTPSPRRRGNRVEAQP